MMLRWLLSRLRPEISTTEFVEPPTSEDYEMLLDLCSVWPDGPAAQMYMSTRNLEHTGPAAEEVRLAIKTSDVADTLIGLYHIEILQRISHASQKNH